MFIFIFYFLNLPLSPQTSSENLWLVILGEGTVCAFRLMDSCLHACWMSGCFSWNGRWADILILTTRWFPSTFNWVDICGDVNRIDPEWLTLCVKFTSVWVHHRAGASVTRWIACVLISRELQRGQILAWRSADVQTVPSLQSERQWFYLLFMSPISKVPTEPPKPTTRFCPQVCSLSGINMLAVKRMFN